MSAIVDTIESISTTIDKLFDYIANDDKLSKEFEEYLAESKVEVSTQAQICDVLTGYLLDVKRDILDSYPVQSDVIKALKDNFYSVFEVKKVEKNAFETYSLTSERDFTLLPLVKMTHLRSICRGDFIKARVVKVGEEYFVLEIAQCIGASRVHIAREEAVKCIVTDTRCAYWQNEAKKLELQESVEFFTGKFEEYFKKSVVSTTNKRVDELLEKFNKFCQSGEKEDYKALLEEPPEYRYFEPKQDDTDPIAGAMGGFGKHSEVYDVALLSDKESGIFVIPFYESIRRMEDKVKAEKLMKKYKRPGFSPTTVLFNSKTFSELLGHKDEPSMVQVVGRNEPCPCGSGKKYKKCCMV